MIDVEKIRKELSKMHNVTEDKIEILEIKEERTRANSKKVYVSYRVIE